MVLHRAGHTLSHVGNKYYLLGGLDQDMKGSNSVWVFEFLRERVGRWKKIENSGNSFPHGRYNHSAEVVGEKIVVVGGGKRLPVVGNKHEVGIYNDVWIFDTRNFLWTGVDLFFFGPSTCIPFYGFHFTVLCGTQLVVLGGGDDETHRHFLSVLDFSSDLGSAHVMVWEYPSDPKYSEFTMKRGFYGAKSLKIGRQIVVVGGSTDWYGLTELSREIVSFWSPPSLFELCLWKLNSSGMTEEEFISEELKCLVKNYPPLGKNQQNKISGWVSI
eukprot:TRINITY_DN4826_c0_g1_i2.p1 TRINITY_DN4826_c0_g1~~TRINITY_DN4826_c0_g1_i2.p1  ORF type:complete len:272 (-),score=64.12 TRINITY_DN4826_c0_g1_i2:103-918(-)